VVEAARQHGSYFNFAVEMSRTHTQNLQSTSLPKEVEASFRTSVQTSLAEQANIDARTEKPFEDFVAAYFA